MTLKIVAANPIFAGHEEVSDGLSSTGDVPANGVALSRPDKSEILAAVAACRNSLRLQGLQVAGHRF